MGVVTTLRDNLKSSLATFLGLGYSELSNVTEVEKNSFKGANNRYGLLAKPAVEVEGTTCFLTINQEFEITLTNSYYSNSKASDVDKRDKTVELQDLMTEFYVETKKTKANSPSLVVHTLNFSMLDPEYLEDDNVVVVKATFILKYRKEL